MSTELLPVVRVSPLDFYFIAIREAVKGSYFASLSADRVQIGEVIYEILDFLEPITSLGKYQLERINSGK
jgi:hypothetical protein